jgi:type IV pilus assembly protein PilW
MTGIRMISKEDGFSLVELFIYMVMLMVVLGALYNVFTTNTKSYSSQENSVEMVQDLRAAMHLMITEIRMAGCDPTDTGTIGFVDDAADDRFDTDANSIHFTMDIDGNGTIANSENINYYLYTSDGVQKIGRRTGDGDLQPVAENITGLTFSYHFDDGDTGVPDETDADTTNDLVEIRSVQISITGQTAKADPITGVNKTRTQTSWAVVRNRGFEYE